MFKFITFIIFTVMIFFVNNVAILVGAFLVTLVIAKVLKVHLVEMLSSLKFFLPFILFTAFINVILSDLELGVLIGMRMLVCYNITYIFYFTTSVMEIADAIEKLFYPLKLFKINTSNIGIIVSTAICTIPYFKNSINMKIKAMNIKGKLFKIGTMVIVMKPILISVLRKTNEMEKCLIAKGYDEQ